MPKLDARLIHIHGLILRAVIFLPSIIALAILGVGSVLALIFLRPDQENFPIITVILGIITPTLVSIMSLMKANEATSIFERRVSELFEHFAPLPPGMEHEDKPERPHVRSSRRIARTVKSTVPSSFPSSPSADPAAHVSCSTNETVRC